MLQIIPANKSSVTKVNHKKLYDLLIIAYAITEIEVWGENYQRISFNEYKKLIQKGEILIAFLNKDVVGGIHHYKKEKNTYTFSLLCADFNKSGLGIGRALINQVEKLAKENNTQTIQLEILRPKGIEIPFKTKISDWYKRMGYTYSHSQNFAEIRPIKAKNLINPSDFDYYTKNII